MQHHNPEDNNSRLSYSEILHCIVILTAAVDWDNLASKLHLQGGFIDCNPFWNTNSMEQSPSEADSRLADKKIRRLLCNPKFRYRVLKNPPLQPVLRHFNSAHTLTLYFFKIHFNIILHRTSWSGRDLSGIDLFQWLATPRRIREVPGSNLGPETGYPDCVFSWFSSNPPGKYLDITIN
jgi:hypothetical protein